MTVFEQATVATGGAAVDPMGGVVGTLIYMVVIFVLFYFIAIRPQRKEQKRVEVQIASMETGDVVLTTCGFYGVVMDITEDDVIVEFGSNKNCRIAMKKSAIAQVEKAE